MSRIYVNNYDDWGCGYYRCQAPVYQCCGELSKGGIGLYTQKDLLEEEENYDAYVMHRIPIDATIFFMHKIQNQGKKFILELDDDILNIPEWMPSDEYKNPKWSLRRAFDMADEIWVSTNELAESINKPQKTHVVPNLIDINAFRKNPKTYEQAVRILWMGSMWHERDLQQVCKPIERLMNEYGDKVQFLFWGYLPTDFSEYERIPGQNLANLRQKKEYGRRLLYLDGVPFRLYFDRLWQVSPAIGIAPIYDCKFNYSKSNIKFLEYSMVGATTVATDLPPYRCIENGVDGMLVKPGDEEGWYNTLKKLIDDASLRQELANNAKKKTFEKFSWQSQGKKDIWLNAFRNLVRGS